MAELKITDGDLVAPRPVDEALRRVTSPELVGTPHRSADADVDPDAEAAAELPLTGPQIVDHAGETRDLRVVHRPGA
jgi:hypothetical protein